MQEIKLNVNQSKGYEGVVLPQVTTNEEGKKLVSGRELHEALQVSSNFTTWIKRMVDYGFQENVDYITLWNDSKNGIAVDYLGSPQKMSALGYEVNYILSLDMAKHIAMIQRSEIGMKIRNYFIECEKELHQPINQKERLLLQLFSDDKIEVANAHKQLLELETKPLIEKIELQEPMVESFKTYLDTEGTTTVTEACKRFGLKRATVFEHLRNNGLVYKNKVEATVKGIEKGYFKHVVKNGYPTMVVLPKGVEYIKTLKDTPLIKNGIKRLKGYENC